MATASPSPLAPSTETTNGIKLRRLLVDGGTTVLRKVFDGIHLPIKLAANLRVHNSTLDDLFTRGILIEQQRKLLFPSDGFKPESKTFDITLLFLLLSEICGLSPPRTGWNHMPHAKDRSLAAKLVRIKLFRNKIIHTAETRIDTRLFNELWKEISGVLVSLGLDQAEINRLKAERCGEEDYRDILFKWADREKDIKSKLEEVVKRQAKIEKTQQDHEVLLQYSNSRLDKVDQTQEEHSETLQAVKQAVDNLKERRDAGAEEQVLQNLAKSEFRGDIEYLVGRYQEGTREWVFNEVENWSDDRNSENRVMVISSNAGMGKSVISAVICKRMQEDGRLAGSHFCQHNNARYRNPLLMLQSLACHLCHALPEYKQALVKQLSRNLGNDLNNMGVEELFALLFKEPLSHVADPGRNMLMVIDGVDESDYQEHNELLDVIANHLCKLPRWIRFLCTTRPERNISEALKHLKPFLLESNDDKNMEDIKLFIENRTQHLIKPEKKCAIVEKLVKKSEGLMLYANFLVLFIQENESVLDQGNLDDSLPLEISSVYHSYFKRLEHELKEEVGINEEDFLNLLCAVIASREPMPIEFAFKLLGPNASSPLARRKVRKAINSVSSLLPIRDGCLHVIHKSVKDWLTDASCYGEHHFIMDEKEGHRILGKLCADELDHLKQRGARDAQFSATEKYALHHGVRHMLQLEKENVRRLDYYVETYVIDLDLLYAKLCLNSSIAAGDISWLQSQDLFQALSKDSKDKLNTLIFLLRRYFSTLTNHPHVFVQTLLNEGGPDLSPMASNMLHTKFLEMPYMEFVNKEMQEGAVLARFYFSSRVACFDVSPQLDYMVCECDDGTIQLWSLRTGELLWTRPVKVTKCYHNAFRVSPFLSFYRSVVFHPTEQVVLPGVLSHAYDLNGDLKPLFPESNCSFTVCSVSGDKTKILTDCPDDVKCIIMWSLKNGLEIDRTTRNEAVLSFAWSRDGKLLAISHCTGFISIVDVVDGFRTLRQTGLLPWSCGMIRFSSDCRSLFCWRLRQFPKVGYACRFDIQITENTTSLCKSPDLLEFESHSDGGFLLGDPLPWFDLRSYKSFTPFYNSHFALDERTVLKRLHNGYYLEMTKPEEEVTNTRVKEIVFSLSEETIYVLREGRERPKGREVCKGCEGCQGCEGREGIISAWNVSTGKLIEKKIFDLCTYLDWRHGAKFILPVKGGVLLLTGSDTLEMWNFKLSKCVESWTNIRRIAKMIAISEERVAIATEERKLIILDTTSGKIVSTVPFGRRGYLLACNSKCHLLTLTHGKRISLQLSDGETTLWKEQVSGVVQATFSPAETFLIKTVRGKVCYRYHVLDAVLGKTLHRLCRRGSRWHDYKFVSDEECVVASQSYTRGSHVQLFNVRSGDLLSIIDVERSAAFMFTIAACPGNRLLAVEEKDSERGFELIQVHIPRVKDSRKMKR